MPFGIIGRTGPGMRHVLGFVDQSTGRGTFGANLGHAIVTNGDLLSQRRGLFPNLLWADLLFIVTPLMRSHASNADSMYVFQLAY